MIPFLFYVPPAYSISAGACNHWKVTKRGTSADSDKR